MREALERVRDGSDWENKFENYHWVKELVLAVDFSYSVQDYLFTVSEPIPPCNSPFK